MRASVITIFWTASAERRDDGVFTRYDASENVSALPKAGSRFACPRSPRRCRDDQPPFFFITALMFTDLPPCRLLSSAASMKAKISSVSSAETGAMPV